VGSLGAIVYHNKLAASWSARNACNCSPENKPVKSAPIRRLPNAPHGWRRPISLQHGRRISGLQGIMGRYIPLSDGDPPLVAMAIEQHYRRVFRRCTARTRSPRRCPGRQAGRRCRHVRHRQATDRRLKIIRAQTPRARVIRNSDESGESCRCTTYVAAAFSGFRAARSDKPIRTSGSSSLNATQLPARGGIAQTRSNRARMIRHRFDLITRSSLPCVLFPALARSGESRRRNKRVRQHPETGRSKGESFTDSGACAERTAERILFEPLTRHRAGDTSVSGRRLIPASSKRSRY